MDVVSVIPVLLLLMFLLAVSVGVAVGALVLRGAARERRLGNAKPIATRTPEDPCATCPVSVLPRPVCWLAIRCRNLLTVKSVLGLHNVKPCPLHKGLSGEERMFIAPPAKGWIVVTGSDLPDPAEDVDACFRFIVQVSRKLGHVQFFRASSVLNHHAWVRADRGRILRAYAWAGHTLWKQGRRTPAEDELDMKCFDYCEQGNRNFSDEIDPAAVNTERVAKLAARWSLDPARLEPLAARAERGLTGETSYQF